MRNSILFFLLSLSFNSFSQEQKKDSLFFSFDKDYIFFSNDNYDQDYFFKFKNEKLVTSAFGKISNEDLFYFTQSEKKINKTNPKKEIDLKKFIKKNSKIFIDKSTQKLDAYKLMRFFDNYKVFFLVKNKFILVASVTTLSE